ncbi:hypothetical protein AVEN_1959-1 [Araneus ventricosus]|uniref:Uncharacterized protein n=1 Tax=Araneus ventricosus TaxID=182803 RepID=A0A4Y2PGH1_ARAVE|nr:hypothetical protein AVEN_1959-1 [Araneus ventricosus]
MQEEINMMSNRKVWELVPKPENLKILEKSEEWPSNNNSDGVWAKRTASWVVIQPGSNQPGPVRGAVVLLEYSSSMWMTVQHQWMEVIAQQLYVPNRI